MRNKFSKVLLWLFVINLGIALGAGLYESLIVVPAWFSSSPESPAVWNAAAAERYDTGQHFWIFVTTIPLSLLTVVNLWAAWRSKGKIRTWWLTACFLIVAERLFTFLYFIPTMLELMQDHGMSQSDATAMALEWANLNYFRHAIVFLAWIAALRALSMSGGRELFVRRFGPYR
jgi:hypothetical protein